MPKLIFLGTAASIPTPQKDNTSFLFIYKKEIFLIDCPGAVVQKLLKVNLDYNKINKIILTHHHPDHIYGLSHLIHAQCYNNKKITIFCNKITQRVIKKIIKAMGLDKKEFPQVSFRDVLVKSPFYKNNNLSLKAIRNKHCFQSFGVIFSWKNKSLLYSSDTALCSNIVNYAKKSTYLIHDCTASLTFFNKYPSLFKMHTPSAFITREFKKHPLKKIIPIHFLLRDKKEERKIEKELIPLIKRGKILLPYDLMKVTL